MKATEKGRPCKVNSLQQVNKFPIVYRIQRFITVFYRPRYLSLFRAKSSSRPPILLNIFILSPHSMPNLKCSSFFLAFPPQLCTNFSSHPCLPHSPPILFDWITWIIFGAENTLKHISCSTLQSPVMSRYLLWHPILEHPQPMFPHTVRDQVPHPYKTRGRTRVMYILIYIFLYSKH